MHDIAVTAEMGSRLAYWARTWFPRDTAKHLSRATGASPHTTKKWAAGAWPDHANLSRLAKLWGPRFVAFLFEPAVGPWAAAAIDIELEAREHRLAELERSYREEADDLVRTAPVALRPLAALVLGAPGDAAGPEAAPTTTVANTHRAAVEAAAALPLSAAGISLAPVDGAEAADRPVALSSPSGVLPPAPGKAAPQDQCHRPIADAWGAVVFGEGGE